MRRFCAASHGVPRPSSDRAGGTDYTDDPEENLLPGEVNMAKLRDLYTSRRLRRVEEGGAVVETTYLVRR